jgi:hypothetical protein
VIPLFLFCYTDFLPIARPPWAFRVPFIGSTASRAPLTAPLAAPVSILPITFSTFFTRPELLTRLTAFVTPDLFAMRDSVDFLDPFFFGLNVLALARRALVVFFFAAETFEPLSDRETVARECDVFDGMIFESPLVDELGSPRRRRLSASNFSVNAERVSTICW